MRLLWVQDAFWPDLRGGAERRAFHLVQALSERGHQVDVLARQTVSTGQRHETLGEVRIHRVPTGAINPRLWRIRPWLWMRQWSRIYDGYLNGQGYDGAIVFQPEAAYYLRRFRSQMPIVIATGGTWRGAKAHEFDQPGRSLSMRVAGTMTYWQYYAYERLGNSVADYVVAESANVQEQLVRLYGLDTQRVPIVGNGVDHELFHPRERDRDELRAALGWSGDSLVVIGVGRLDRVKNFEYSIRALADALARGVNAQAVIVGEGSERERLQRMAETLGLTDRVSLVGHRSDVPALLAAADVFLLPSVFESYGNAWIEAMASGLPCMGLRHEFGRVHSAAGEHIDHGRTGYLLDPADPSDCGGKLAELTHRPLLRKRMGAAARDRAVEAYRWEATAIAYETLIERALRKYA